MPAGACEGSGGEVLVMRVQGTRNGLVCAAIAGRRVVRFAYDGQERVVQPHVHGLTAEGIEAVSGYQVAGGSVRGPVPDWRMFHVDKMGGFQDAGFGLVGPRPDYDPAKVRISVVCCRL